MKLKKIIASNNEESIKHLKLSGDDEQQFYNEVQL